MSRPVSLPRALKPIRVSSPFGKVRTVNGKKTPPHDGCDWATPVGLPLESGIRGKVSSVGGSNTNVWGFYVHVMCECPKRHVQEFHILRDDPDFEVGDRIEIGQRIGFTGKSGRLNGKNYDPHHHLGTVENGKHFDPLDIGWPDAAYDTHNPLDNTEDFMTEQQYKEVKATLANIEALLAQKDDGDGPGGIRGILRRLRTDLSGTRDTLNNVEQIVGGAGGIANGVAAIFTMVGALASREPGEVASGMTSVSTEDLARIAKAVADEQHKRSAE